MRKSETSIVREVFMQSPPRSHGHTASQNTAARSSEAGRAIFHAVLPDDVNSHDIRPTVADALLNRRRGRLSFRG
jgi:hypothetical protein